MIKLPGFIQQAAERAIHEANNPVGMRRKFHEWCEQNDLDTELCNKAPVGVYNCRVSDEAWEVWQAAYRSVSTEKKPIAYYIKATGAFYLNKDRISNNDRLLGITELCE